MTVGTKTRRARIKAASVVTLAAATTLSAVVGLGLAMAGPASAAAKATGPCPNSNSLSNFHQDANVGATFTNDTTTKTTSYSFKVLTAESSTGGVAGLIKYCVYPTAPGAPASVTVDPNLAGADGAHWTSAAGTDNFAFMRPGGNKSNLPLSPVGTTAMGTASWTTLPTDQTILLHIADPTMCAQLYPGTGASTCFVLPSTGPICNDGNHNVAYNAMPFDVENCGVPALGFEATTTNEFGDQVGLGGTARTLQSLQVAFGSYACSVSGHWNTGDCVTTPGTTFTHPITANIYAVNTSDPTLPGALLATDTTTQTIPYRPSADNVNCTGTDAGKWFNPASGFCQNSIITTLTFDTWTYQNGFTGTLPDNVIWTVAFNTSTAGYTPIGTAPCSSTPPGCPYDSLNVGAQTFPNAPYAGTDTDANVAFRSVGAAALKAELGWASNRPLGRITAT